MFVDSKMLLTGSMNLTNTGVDSNAETCSIVPQGPILIDSMSRWMRVVELVRLTLVSSQQTPTRKQLNKERASAKHHSSYCDADACVDCMVAEVVEG